MTSWRRDNDMHVLGAAVDNMPSPTANPAMIGNRGFHEAALLGVQGQSGLGHEPLGLLLEFVIRRPELAGLRDPTTFVSGQPCTVGGPG